MARAFGAKGTGRALVTVRRPGDRHARRKPVPMSDPAARKFFGGNVHYVGPEASPGSAPDASRS